MATDSFVTMRSKGSDVLCLAEVRQILSVQMHPEQDYSIVHLSGGVTFLVNDAPDEILLRIQDALDWLGGEGKLRAQRFKRTKARASLKALREMVAGHSEEVRKAVGISSHHHMRKVLDELQEFADGTQTTEEAEEAATPLPESIADDGSIAVEGASE